VYVADTGTPPAFSSPKIMGQVQFSACLSRIDNLLLQAHPTPKPFKLQEVWVRK